MVIISVRIPEDECSSPTGRDRAQRGRGNVGRVRWEGVVRSGDGLDPMTKVNVAQVPQKGPRGSMFWESIVKIGNDV